jgi:hypothetical protein
VIKLKYRLKRIIGLLFIGMFLSSCKKDQHANYYIPQNYQGFFAVVYNQVTGTNPSITALNREAFIIPENGILVTKAAAPTGLRDDIFLQNTENGFKMVKMYLPDADTSGKTYYKNYYPGYSVKPDEHLIHSRQTFEYTFESFDKSQKQNGPCTFQYELVAVGHSKFLTDSIKEVFKVKLKDYLKAELCK